jgi:hypothetical protein
MAYSLNFQETQILVWSGGETSQNTDPVTSGYASFQKLTDF